MLVLFGGCNLNGFKKSDKIVINSDDTTQSYFVFIDYKSSKYGYMNSKGEVIISLCFEYAEDFVDGLAKVKTSKGFGLMNKGGQFILQPIYLDCKYLGNDLVAYKTQKWRINLKNGKETDKLEFEEINNFSEGLAAVKMDGKWGFIDIEGNLKIKPIFDHVTGFKNSLSDIKVNDSWGMIDINGKVVVEPKFESRLWVLEDYILVQDDNGKWGYLNSKGEQIIDYVFENADHFSEGLAPVYKDGKWGYINKQGIFAIKPTYEEAKKFNKGLALVKRDNKYYYINTDGTVIKETNMYYTNLYGFYEQRAAIKKDNKYGFVNENMDIIVEPEYDDYKDFSEGFAVVGKKVKGSYDNVYGYVDITGKWLIEPIFSNAESFKNGLAKVWKSGKMGYIDMSGNEVYKTW